MAAQVIPSSQSMATNGTNITGAFVQEFHRGFELACQQKQSRFQGAVTDRGSITGSSFTINDMGTVEFQDRTSADRFGDTLWSVPDAGTRVALMGDADLYVPVEKFDLPKLLANPQGPYQQLMVAAANRKKDTVIYNALLGSIGRRVTDGGNLTSTALPAAQKIGATPTAFNKAAIIATKALFRANEADEEAGEELYFAYNAAMLQAILSDTTLTNADFMAIQMLQTGQVAGKWLGFNWIPYEKMKVTGTGTDAVTTTVAWAKSGLHFGTGIDMSIDVGPRRDKRNVIQLSGQLSFGAGRSNEQKVVAIDFK